MDLQLLHAQLDSPAAWPDLPLKAWKDTHDTLHLWTQVVGKIQLSLTPRVNHWWNVALQVSPRGISSVAIPYGTRLFQMEFDLQHHNLLIRSSDGAQKTVPLFPRSVADFYTELMAALRAMGIQVSIHGRPDEVPDPIPFEEDHAHASYDSKAVERFWRALASSHIVFQEFRARFVGKCSPVHFFWGSFDLAVSRFSGRRAPEREGADAITKEGYSHEVSSLGFWAGGPGMEEPVFYAYQVPAPPGFEDAVVQPGAATWNPELKEFILPYAQLRSSARPREDLLAFAQSTYEAGATAAGWNRSELERKPEVEVEELPPPSEHRMEPAVH